MEPESIAASALVSAFVSWFVASRVTIRQERAKRRESGLLALRDAVQPRQDQLSRYRFVVRRERPDREVGGSMHLEDLQHVIEIRRASSAMALWRRWLIDRRLRTIYGNSLLDLARDYPSAREDAADAGFTTWIAASLSDYEMKDHPASSLLHRTYSAPPSAQVGKRLAYELRWLARGL